MSGLQNTIVTAGALGAACAVLSVFVVLRRWAFIGEGIAHAGFGGAGTAWLLSLLFPTAAWLGREDGIFAVAVFFCMAVAMGIAWITRREQVRTDTAIGIFLVTSLAWGFVGYSAYKHLRGGVEPPAWEDYAFGRIGPLSASEVLASVLVCGAVVLAVALLGKEIVCYCFDPMMAEVSGVRVALIHYLLLALVTLTILMGMRLMGSLLVTALLVLPGATGLQLSRNLRTVLISAIAVGVLGAIAGPMVSAKWRFIREGPAIVLALVAQFVAAYAWASLRRRNLTT
jgi:ABC-type Mn2+/Zn2+ transport system permease subunit